MFRVMHALIAASTMYFIFVCCVYAQNMTGVEWWLWAVTWYLYPKVWRLVTQW